MFCAGFNTLGFTTGMLRVEEFLPFQSTSAPGPRKVANLDMLRQEIYQVKFQAT